MPHVVAVVLGLVLLAVELFLAPGTLWLGLIGALLLLAGIALSIGGVGSGLDYPLDRAILFDSLFQLALWSAAALGAAFFLSRHLERLPLLRRLVLGAGRPGAVRGQAWSPWGTRRTSSRCVGALGRAATDLRPVGKVVLDGQGSRGLRGARGRRGARPRRARARRRHQRAPPGGGGRRMSLALAIALFGLGLALIVAELLFPSFGMLSVLAAGALIGAVAMAFALDADTGFTFLAVAAVAVPAALLTGLKLFPQEPARQAHGRARALLRVARGDG